VVRNKKGMINYIPIKTEINQISTVSTHRENSSAPGIIGVTSKHVLILLSTKQDEGEEGRSASQTLYSA
jgi:hypothetical protein